MVRAAEPAPSADLLLYLAEFADDEGQPEDPIDLTTSPADTPEDHEDRTNDTPPHPKRVDAND